MTTAVSYCSIVVLSYSPTSSSSLKILHHVTLSVVVFSVVKVNCVDLPVKMEGAVWPMRKETGGATAGRTFQGSAVRLTTAQTTA